MRTLDFSHTHEAKGQLLVPGKAGDPLYPTGATFNSDGTVEITDEMVVPMPAEGEPVETGVIYEWGDKLWVCYQPHTRMHFDPDQTPALFGVMKEAWAAWVQPLGAHDAYQTGDKVTHNDSRWISTVDNNIWAPGVYGWTEQI